MQRVRTRDVYKLVQRIILLVQRTIHKTFAIGRHGITPAGTEKPPYFQTQSTEVFLSMCRISSSKVRNFFMQGTAFFHANYGIASCDVRIFPASRRAAGTVVFDNSGEEAADFPTGFARMRG